MAAEPNGDNPALELGLSPGSEDSGASSPLGALVSSSVKWSNSNRLPLLSVLGKHSLGSAQ